MTYAVYGRNTPRHSWRLQSLVLNPTLATAQANALQEAARARGYQQAEFITKAVGSAYDAPEAWDGKKDANTTL